MHHVGMRPETLGDQEVTSITLSVAILSLVVSMFVFVLAITDDVHERQVEQRLACLELPGSNDCGVDAK